MLDQLLVTLDGSEFGEQALPFARAIAQKTGAAVILSHVRCCDPPTDLLQNTPFQYEGVNMEAYDAKHVTEQESYLNKKVGELKADLPDTEVRWALLEGYVTESLERHAEEIGANLVVMTTHGRTGVSRAWLGSVADSLVRHSSLPLLVIRPLEDEDTFPEARFQHFLVPLDGSTNGEQILTPAMELAGATGARFTLFHVASPTMTFGARMSPVPAGQLQDRMGKAQSYLEGVQSRLEDQGFRVETILESHLAPARAILRTAKEKDVDLIAMATHGYTGVKRALLGSVTDKVLRGAQWPLLLLRPEQSD